MKWDFYQFDLWGKKSDNISVECTKNTISVSKGLFLRHLVGSTWVFCPLLGSERMQVSMWKLLGMKQVFWVQVWLLEDFSPVWKLLRDKVVLITVKLQIAAKS